MEFDHLFLCVHDAALADGFADAGFTEGSSNRHPGQGTACRRFFFGNAFVEFLYLADAEEAQQSVTCQTLLYERLTDTAACPFGIAFRGPCDEEALEPGHWWQYRPQYLPEHLHIDIGLSPLTEPMWFNLSFATAPVKYSADKQQPLEHSNGAVELIGVTLQLPDSETLSPVAELAGRQSGISIKQGGSYLMKLDIRVVSDAANTLREAVDLRPQLPVVIRFSHG